jgi:hypothetical protein
MWKAMAMMLGLMLLSSNLQPPTQEKISPRAELVHRFEYGAGDDSIMEATLDLASRIKEHGSRVAVRLCSKDPLPLALFTNAISPTLVVAKNLGFVHNLTTQDILYLRSEDCMSSNPLASAGELWVIPRGASLPSSVESVKYCQLLINNVASAASIKSSQDYRAKLKELASKLSDNPRLILIVIGNYYENPRPILKQNLYQARKFFQQSGLPKSQYFVRLQLWTGSYSGNPSEPELRYPNIFVAEILNDCK